MRTKYSIKNTITSFISNIITFIFLFVSQTIFIKIMGIEYTGINGLFSNILTLFSLFELGIGNAIIYNLYKYISKGNKEKIKSLMYFYKKAYLTIAFIILVVGLLITPFIPYIVNNISVDINIYVIYLLFLLSTISTYIISYKRNLLYADQRNYITNIIHLISIILLNIIQLLIIYLTKNYYLYLVMKIVFTFIENIIINIKTNKDYPYLLDKNVSKLDKNTKKDIITRVKSLSIHKVSAVITYSTDNILISYFFGIIQVGLYTNYYYIINTIDILFRGIILSTSASVGNLLVEKDYDDRLKVFERIRFLNFIITVFTSVCLFNLIEPFIIIWLGKEYILGKFLLIVLIINYYQSMMRTTFNVFKDSAGIWEEDKHVPIIQIIINVVSSIILLKIFGLPGIFLGTITSSLVVWIYSYPKFIYKKLFNKSLKKYFIDLSKELLLGTIVITLSYLIINSISFNNLIINLIIKLIISILIPIISLYLIYRKNDKYKYYKELLLKSVKRKS